jgi:FkbM family methyltransferase
MTRAEWYRTAIKNLGLLRSMRLQFLKRYGTQGRVSQLTSKDLLHPVLARNGSSDLAVFGQIFAMREYRCLDFVQEPGLIVDCGANVGYSSAYFLSRYPKSLVLAVEPDPGNFLLLQRNVRPYGDRCQTIQAAVWWRSETLRFKQPATQGQEWACAVETGPAAGNPVPSITIPMLLGMTTLERISILKIDIEGSEMELFDHNPDWLDSVDNIVIELHSDACRNLFLQVIRHRLSNISTCGELTVCQLRRPS